MDIQIHSSQPLGFARTPLLLLLLSWMGTASVGASTATPLTAEAHLVDVPVPGIRCTNASGQVTLKGTVHRLRVHGDDARLTGRFQGTFDRGYLGDGSSRFTGSACQEVGTWDLRDPLHPEFTPTGGVWDLLVRGTSRSDGSVEMHVTGHGLGGGIEGLLLEESMTRGPGGALDPTLPYQATATIQAAPQTTVQVVDDFEDRQLSPLWHAWSSNGQGTLLEDGGHLTLRGHWPGPKATSPSFAWAKGWIYRPWTVPDGATLESRVDLVSVSDGVSMVKLDYWSQLLGVGYGIALGPDFVAILKWISEFAVLHCERAVVPRTEVTLAVGLTRVQTNLVLSARILDTADPSRVLYQHVLVDTPLADPSLSPAEFRELTGMAGPVVADRKGPPMFSGDSLVLEMLQYTDGTQPPMEAIYDRLELRTDPHPPITVEPAARLVWPGSDSGSFSVECAPAVGGPWLPVGTAENPALRTLTVPAHEGAGFFRLRRAP